MLQSLRVNSNSDVYVMTAISIHLSLGKLQTSVDARRVPAMSEATSTADLRDESGSSEEVSAGSAGIAQNHETYP